MVKTVELGCPGHFICAHDCRYRRHTQVGLKYRVSTVGELYHGGKGEKQTLGASDDSFYETYVFETTGEPSAGSDGCGCIQVVSFSEIDGQRYATAGEASAGHESFVKKYRRLSDKKASNAK